MYSYRATLAKVVDADTLDVVIDLGFLVLTRQRVRLLGINTPEKNTNEGKAAIAWVNEWFDEHGLEVIVTTQRDKREKYGRYLATLTAGTTDLNQALVDAGHARPYDGTGPRPT